MEYKQREEERRMHDWKQKPMHGQFLRQTDEMINNKTWAWLTRGELKKGMESLITAAQDQALTTNAVKAKIDNTHVDSRCRMCFNADKTVNNVACECSKLAQRDNKLEHESVAKAVHWNLCKKFDLECKGKWYEHEPDKVIESTKVKILESEQGQDP